MTKQCKDCYKYKPESAFAKNGKYLHAKCRECQSEYHKKWRSDPENHERLKKYWLKTSKRLTATSPHRRAADKLRGINRRIIKDIEKVRNGTCIDNFGCSKKVFVARFERYFAKNPGMTWQNHGAWHMDHIKPLREFKLDTEADRKAANHYTNLRPVWGTANLKKAAMYEMEQTI